MPKARNKKPAAPQALPVPVAPPPIPTAELLALRDQWAAAWPPALAIWSKFTKLTEPRWCFSAAEAKQEGLTESFAMIRFADQAIVINLEQVKHAHLDNYALEVLAHEIGHHVYAPGDLTDYGRMIARMRWGLPTKEHLAGFISNLYTDLLINDRLQRSANFSMAGVYQTLGQGATTKLWTLYMRIYEILWRFPKHTLSAGDIPAEMEGDAHLGARLIRAYAREWLEGAGKFAALCLPYVLDDDGNATRQLLRVWCDMQNAGAGGNPSGLTEMEAGEKTGALHPAYDPELSGIDAGRGVIADPAPQEATSQGGAQGQHREPFEYGAILKALGLNLSDHEIAVRYYKERATPHLIRFPTRITPQSTEPLPEGLEPWDIGAPLEAADWTESVFISPRIVPGMTTVQRTWGVMDGTEPKKEPLDLDLYVDCSGSMPNPQVNVSYLTLAGAIVALSALRVGAKVQATLWSGANQFETTRGFVSDATKVLQILTGYIGGGTAFPIHILRDTFVNRKPTAHPAHILIISDDGVTTMFDKDEKKNSGWDVSAMALEKARGGGTMVLNLWGDWQKNKDLARANKQGWGIHVIRNWEELVEFARQFSRLKYGAE